MDWRRSAAKCVMAAVAAALVLPSAGCVGLTAQLLYFWKGDKVPAAFEGLKGKRVAVVCVSDASAYGPGAVPTQLARQVEAILQARIKNIDLVGQDNVADWIDRNDWDQIDYREIGRGVKADLVVAIDLDSLRLHDGQTLYKGVVNLKTTVYDMSRKGEVAYSVGPSAFVFPEHTAVHAADMNEAQFRRLFLRILAQHVARYFHEYDLKEVFGNDTVSMGA